MGLGHSFESVLEAAKLGSEWAWAVLYGEIAGPVTGFFRSRGVADPEEATGDVFFELARGIDRFEGTEESFRTLVFVTAFRRLLVDKKYATGRRSSALADRVLDRLHKDGDTVEAPVQGDVPEQVRQAFELLTPPQRDVLSLRMVAGLTVEQTAEVIESGTEIVRDLQRRAMARIRRHMPTEAALA